MAEAETKMFNSNTWYSIRKMKTYSQKFNGNQYTGGKLAASKVATGFKIGGYGLGVYSSVNIEIQYQNGQLSQFHRVLEQGSNLYSTVGGIYGASWGVGWEIGRWITTQDSYWSWKQDTWLPWRKANLGY